MEEKMRLLFLLVLMVSVMGCASEKVVDDRPKHPKTAEQQKFVEGEIIVRYEDDFPEARIHNMLKTHGASIKQKLPGEKQYLIKLPFGHTVRSAVPLYNSLIGVKWAEPNYIYTKMPAPIKRIKIRTK